MKEISVSLASNWPRVALAVALATLAGGCGLVLQGTQQQLAIGSTPSSARAGIGATSLTTPGSLSIPRRAGTGLQLIRVTKPGYRSACTILRWQRNKGLVALDAIPLAIPLLIDAMAWTIPGQFVGKTDILLDELPTGYLDVLPPDDMILDAAANRGFDFCDPPPDVREWMQLKSRFGHKTQRIIAAVGQISQQYQILGNVVARARGTSWFAWSAYNGPASFSFRQYRYKEDPTVINEMLRLKALEQYGEQVDGVVNIYYETMPGNDVSAQGIAVKFIR